MSEDQRPGVAVVTGGASGIGEACALRFARDGRPVAVLDINAEAANAVAKVIVDGGGTARAFACDVADLSVQQDIAKTVEADMGPVDTLLTSAGIITSKGMLMSVDLEEHTRVWDVNYNGTLYSVRAFAPAMQERKRGAICTVGSVNSYIQLPMPAYNPTKIAIKRLTELLAMELGRDMVRVNSVAPGYTLSQTLKRYIDEGKRDPDNILKSGAMKVFIEPEHIANAAAWLCSDEASVVTGVMLPVDAGYLCAAYYQTYAGGLPWEDET
ncbi:MAG: SDR family oxidoreductase [Pseudomonadota bacterium]